jgi:hypothetical protein
MATNIGTGPQDIPLNQFLGEMAFMDSPPQRPAFLAYHPGPADFQVLGNTKITCFSATQYNYFGGYNTSNQTFTVPRSGLYMFGGHIRVGSPGSIRVFRIEIIVNTNILADLLSVGGVNNFDATTGYDHPGMSGTGMFYLNGGDVVELYTANELSASNNVFIQQGGLRSYWFGIQMF